MKPESFDIPAYRFGIVKIDSSRDESYKLKDYQQALLTGRVIIIPFENVDGLTIEEIKKFLRIKEIYLIAYSYYEWPVQEQVKRNYDVIMQVYADEPRIEKTPDTPVDQVFAEILEENYNKLDKRQKRVCHCFFERYQDKSHTETLDRIKRLEKTKNN